MSKNIAHPLTEDRVAELWDEHVPLVLNFQVWTWGDRLGILDAMRAAFDAGRADANASPATVDDAQAITNASLDDVSIGDLITWTHAEEIDGVTIRHHREGFACYRDSDGDWRTVDGMWLTDGEGGGVALSIRRAAQPELPTRDGAILIPAEGREFIEAEVNRQTFITREAVVGQSEFGPVNVLHGAWRMVDDGARVQGQMGRDFITPGTWRTA